MARRNGNLRDGVGGSSRAAAAEKQTSFGSSGQGQGSLIWPQQQQPAVVGEAASEAAAPAT